MVGHEAESMLSRVPVRQNVAEADMGTEFPIWLALTAERTLGSQSIRCEDCCSGRS